MTTLQDKASAEARARNVLFQTCGKVRMAIQHGECDARTQAEALRQTCELVLRELEEVKR